MGARWKLAIGVVVLTVGVAGGAPLAAASSRPAAQAVAGSPTQAHACGSAAAHDAACGAIQLLFPAVNWHPGPNAHSAKGGGGDGGSTPAPPTSGYYPGDLQSAYGLAAAAAAFGPGKSAPTVAVVDAYNDPYAASDLAAYRASLSGATDTATGITDAAIPPLCSSTTSTGCVTFTKVNQSGGSTYPKGNTGWSEEISVDLDMISAICPDCNIDLVEASSSSFSNLDAAVTYAKTLHPAAITNSYGGSEFSSESTYNSTYTAGASTAVTAATGDSGYGVEFPAASPGLTAVGGTSLTYTSSGSSLAWNPQTVWSTAGSGCSAYETMPRWQKDSGVYSLATDCSRRQVADVAAVANPNTGVAVYDTYHEPGWMVFGGTSVSAQIIGAVYALAAGAGSFRPTPSALYPDAAAGGTGPTTGLVPVTSGANGACGDYLCDAATALSSGYNGPTGLGTPEGVGAFATASAGSLSFNPTSESLTAGTWTGPFTVDLTKAAPAGGVSIALTTSSTAGKFSTASSGAAPSQSLVVSIAAGSSASGDLYYSDTMAGTPTVTASASGWAGANLAVVVNPGPLATIAVSPNPATVTEGGSQVFTATGSDKYGNPVSVDPSWTTTGLTGSFTPSSGSTTTFTDSSSTGSGSVTATVGTTSGSATVTVTSLRSMSVAVTAGPYSKKGPNYHVPITVNATDATAGAIGGASVSLQVFAGATCTGTAVASGTGTTGTNGQVTFTFTTRRAGTWCAQATVTASGYSPGTGQVTFTS